MMTVIATAVLLLMLAVGTAVAVQRRRRHHSPAHRYRRMRSALREPMTNRERAVDRNRAMLFEDFGPG